MIKLTTYLSDTNSIALTVVSSLIRKYNIDPRSIGRLEVGTETILDKSKSVKSVLMQLFEEYDTNIEGVDTYNACYGGTNALFNTLNWIDSYAWDGRDAIVVCGDIAAYNNKRARPSGGAGCVAMLIGPDSPLAFEPGLRGTYMRHAYDFYKPDPTHEYPYVDGQLSLKCYGEALDACYKAYLAREAILHASVPHANGNSNPNSSTAASSTNGTKVVLPYPSSPADRFDYMCFHSPTGKTVIKSYARLYFNDYLADSENPLFKDIPAEFKTSSDEAVWNKVFQSLTKKRFAQRVQPGCHVPMQCGNMYTASLYSSLCSLLGHVRSEELQGKRIGLFSYGSGLASSMFSLKVVGNTDEINVKLDLQRRLDARHVVDPAVYEEVSNEGARNPVIFSTVIGESLLI
jgi:hydroxymethylglutaryl-CoA synthase